MWFLPVFYGLILWRLRLVHLNGFHQLVFGFSAFDRRYWFWGLIGRIFSSCLFIIYSNSNQIWSLFLFGWSQFSCSFLFLLTEIAAFVSCWWQVIIVGNWWLLNHHTDLVALGWSLCWSLWASFQTLLLNRSSSRCHLLLHFDCSSGRCLGYRLLFCRNASLLQDHLWWFSSLPHRRAGSHASSSQIADNQGIGCYPGLSCSYRLCPRPSHLYQWDQDPPSYRDHPSHHHHQEHHRRSHLSYYPNRSYHCLD